MRNRLRLPSSQKQKRHHHAPHALRGLTLSLCGSILLGAGALLVYVPHLAECCHEEMVGRASTPLRNCNEYESLMIESWKK